MSELSAGPLHAYLTGTGCDFRGRFAADVLGFSNDQLEVIHDYIQWLFPLPSRSAAQPNAPVLTNAEIEAISADARASDTLLKASERMLQFYRETNAWLTWHDHNHLRITRIINSLRLLIGPHVARQFHEAILALHDEAGNPINHQSLRYWAEAAAS